MSNTSPAGSEERKMVSVDANALGQVLRALNGPGHYIRELQVTRDLDNKGLSLERNPINLLIEQYNSFVEDELKKDNDVVPLFRAEFSIKGTPVVATELAGELLRAKRSFESARAAGISDLFNSVHEINGMMMTEEEVNALCDHLYELGMIAKQNTEVVSNGN
jgi:hypothetical protein